MRGFALGARLVGLILLVVSVPLLWWGAQLLWLGGSAYYVLAGFALLASAVLLFLRRAAGAWLYALILCVTIIWALYEAGARFWPQVPRLGGPLLLGLLMALPFVWRPLAGWPRGRLTAARGGALVAGSLVVSVLAGLVAHQFAPPLPERPIYRTGMTSAPAARTADVPQGGDWLNYGNDLGGSRFSPLSQINTDNVGQLKVAWQYRVGPDATGAMPIMEANPLKVGDTVYLCTAYSDIIALDAETGAQKWRYRSGRSMDYHKYSQCRGVAYHHAAGRQQCADRILLGTIDARLVAVDARDGKPCADFGDNGSVNLMDGMGDWGPVWYSVTSAPTVVRGKVVLDSWVWDGQQVNGPSGVIRAFDAVTGKLAWAFDVGNEERTGAPPPGETYTPGTPSAWAPTSADAELGLVYIPFGNASPDYHGGARRPFDEKVNTAIVALDADTGRMRWRFQTVHEDRWDMDLPSQPTLADVRVNGVMRKALIQATKRGEFFVLDRATGEPLHKVEELPVPQEGKVPGERLSPTQPFSTGMPSTRIPDPVERTAWGISAIDQLWCRLRFRKARYDGPFTPIGTQETIMTPGTMGANSWGSVAIDKDRGLMVMNSMPMAGWVRLLPRADADRAGLRAGHESALMGHRTSSPAQIGLPYAALYGQWMSPIGVPCSEPPFGMMSAVDLNSGKLVWTKPLGLASESGPWGLRSGLPIAIGTPNTGGTIVTRGGLSFVGAAQDGRLRAFDTATGKELWSHHLPAGAMSTPSTYTGKSGKQYLVVAASGHAYINAPPGDYVIAFALPDQPAKR